MLEKLIGHLVGKGRKEKGRDCTAREYSEINEVEIQEEAKKATKLRKMLKYRRNRQRLEHQ